MSQHFFNSSNSRRCFTSTSAFGGNGGIRISEPSICQSVMTPCEVQGVNNSSRSFHNFGGRHRISYCIGHQNRNYGDGDLDAGCVVGHSILAGDLCFGTNLASCRGQGIREVCINKQLLEPLYLGIDPHDQQVKTNEKEQLKVLNNQFACFINKVCFLEQQNQVLRTKWELLQKQTVPTVKKDLKPLCENYISNLRRKLDCLLCEKNKLESQHKVMQNLIEENRCKYEDELSRRTHKENDFVLLKQQVDNAYKCQKELELKRELLKENVEFLINFFTEEIAILDCKLHDTSVVVNMNNSRDLDMDALIQNIESWYQNIAQRSKEEVNLFYQTQMEDLQNKQFQYHENLKKNNSEITELTRVVQIMRCQVDSEKKKVASLQTAIGDTEQRGDCALRDARAKHLELQNSLQNAKDKMASLLRDYHELMNTKLALDIEIATYKRMLEGEESRICTGMPVSVDPKVEPTPERQCQTRVKPNQSKGRSRKAMTQITLGPNPIQFSSGSAVAPVGCELPPLVEVQSLGPS